MTLLLVCSNVNPKKDSQTKVTQYSVYQEKDSVLEPKFFKLNISAKKMASKTICVLRNERSLSFL